MINLWNAIDNHKFDNSVCFLCGSFLTQETKTDEHVIPKWVQEKFNLWDQKLILLNRTEIPYRYLYIPACVSCNCNYLQPLERKISNAVKNGYEAVKEIEKTDLYLWLGKIFYGIIYKELFLKYDRENPENGFITSPELLHSYKSHHFFLQSIRVKMNFRDFFPASIFIFNLQKPNNIRAQFDFMDSLHSMFIGIRLGEIGLIAVLQDGGAQQSIGDYFDRYNDKKLHPIQFLELCATINYKSHLFNRTPKYIFVDSTPIEVMQSPLGGLSGKPIFDEWNMEIYSEVLKAYTRNNDSGIYVPPDKVMSWLRDENGIYKNITFQDLPWGD